MNRDLGMLHDFVHRWWISACDSARDPGGRRHTHARAARILAGKPAPPARLWRELIAERESSRQVYKLSLDPVVEGQIEAVPAEALRPLAELFTLPETAT